MNAYPKRILCFLQEFAYLLYNFRNKGAVAVYESLDLDDFEPAVRGIVRLGLEGITSGLVREQLRMFLEIRKLGLLKDPSVTAEDLKLVQICIESIYYFDVQKFEDFRGFANVIIEVEGIPDDRNVISQIINFLNHAEEEKLWISKEKFNEHINEIEKKPLVEDLSKEEIDKLLNQNFSKGGIGFETESNKRD